MLIGLFQWYGLVDNVEKSKAMTCQPGTLRYRMLEEAVVQWCMGIWATYQERLRRRIPCLVCIVDLNMW